MPLKTKRNHAGKVEFSVRNNLNESPPRPCFSVPLSRSGFSMGRFLLLLMMLPLLGDLALGAEEISGVVTRSLEAKPGPLGKTMFTEMPSAQTGIVTENPYNDPKMWNELYLEFTVGGIGTGVAIGDVDRDGRPDIFVVSKTGPNRLFRNLGAWKFEDVTDRAGVGGPLGNWKQGATFVDIDNDGWLDLYVCRFGAPNLLYINQRDGAFNEMGRAYGLDVVDASGMAAFCDYDRDGKLDVYIHTNLYNVSKQPNGQRDYLFHNNGNNTFTNVTDRAGISGLTQGHSATWWDYDNDGWPDLYVANDFAAPDQLYHNNGGGTFTDVIDATLPHIPHSSMGADLGDINNDGLIDFFVMDMAATSYEKDQRGMAGERARSVEEETTVRKVPQYLRNSLFLNTNTPVLPEAAQLSGLAATDWAWSARFEDLDNDGRLDLQVTNGMIREETNADLLTKMMVAETPAERIRLLRNSPVLAERNLAFRNSGDLTFQEVSAEWGLDQSGVSFGAAFGDLDGDGDLDLVHANFEKGITVLRNDAQGGHSTVIELRGTRSNAYGVGAVARIETSAGVQVRQLVLARGYLSNSEPILHFGLGNETQIQRLTIEWPSGVTQVLEHLLADRRYTITEPNEVPKPLSPVKRVDAQTTTGQFSAMSAASGLDFVQREQTVNETAEQRLLSVRHNRRGPSVAVADLDGDGRDDAFFGGTTMDSARVAILDAQGKFALLSLEGSPAATNDGPVLIFDANGDGREDLLLTRGGASQPDGAKEYQPQLYLNSGSGLAKAPDGLLPSLHFSVGAAAVADWDRNGTLDVFLGGRLMPGEYPLAPASALLSNQRGRFVNVISSVAAELEQVGMVTSALWTDVDGDGWLDLLVAVEWGGIRYFHNDQGLRLEDWSKRAGFEAAGMGWWNSIAAADFNGDGRMDYAVGNTGLNLPFRADRKHPAILYYGEFGGNEGPQIIEGRYDGDRIVPWRSRKELGSVMPSILKAFPSNNVFARQTLEAIFGANKISAAQRFAATEFRSGVFLSQPEGSHRFEALPQIGQIAPIFGLAAGDFDGDGFSDLCAVQNSFAPVASIGRFDGGIGQLFKGDGHGHFSAVAPTESGFVVPGDAKGLAVIDFDQDGWPDFIATRNNSTNLLFKNRGFANRHSFGVILQGATGNPKAVGARITVELANGARQTSEVHLGGGYMSQSSAIAFFGYPDGIPPRRISIRWPDGHTTERTLTGPSVPSRLTFSILEK